MKVGIGVQVVTTVIVCIFITAQLNSHVVAVPVLSSESVAGKGKVAGAGVESEDMIATNPVQHQTKL